MNTIRVSDSLDPDKALGFVGPDLGPNCLQRLSEDVVKSVIIWTQAHNTFYFQRCTLWKIRILEVYRRLQLINQYWF